MTHLFFSPHVCVPACDKFGCDGRKEEGRYERARLAKAVCHHCPVNTECLTWALTTELSDGIAGGLTERERYYALKLAEDKGWTIEHLVRYLRLYPPEANPVRNDSKAKASNPKGKRPKLRSKAKAS